MRVHQQFTFPAERWAESHSANALVAPLYASILDESSVTDAKIGSGADAVLAASGAVGHTPSLSEIEGISYVALTTGAYVRRGAVPVDASVDAQGKTHARGGKWQGAAVTAGETVPRCVSGQAGAYCRSGASRVGWTAVWTVWAALNCAEFLDVALCAIAPSWASTYPSLAAAVGTHGHADVARGIEGVLHETWQAVACVGGGALAM